MKGKFDSYRDSALHYLCSVEWGNESFGDVSTYGVYIWRITNKAEDLKELESVLEEWEEVNPEREGSTELPFFDGFCKTLVGNFLVSENEQGLVTVKEFTLESELIRHFNSMKAHFEEFESAEEED